MKLLLISLFLIFACNNSTESSGTSISQDCPESLDCAGICGGSSKVDACGICDGNGPPCEEQTWTIYYNTSTPIAGFQFNVDGVTPLSISGGAASQYLDFLNFNSNTGLILGASMSGGYIPAGGGVLVILEITGSGNARILTDGLIVSSTTGTELPASVENCNTIQIP